MNLFKASVSAEDRRIIDNIAENGIERKKSEELLFNRYSYFIREAVNKYSLLYEEAFDLYADTIISAIETISRGLFHERSSLKTWLYSIFHNKYVDLIRKKTTNKGKFHNTLSISEMLLKVSDQAKTILQQLTEKTDYEILKQKMSAMGENCKRILLGWAEGYSDKELAISFEYKTADVMKTIRLRCLDKLKQLYRSA